jgi:hypothetical protein
MQFCPRKTLLTEHFVSRYAQSTVEVPAPAARRNLRLLREAHRGLGSPDIVVDNPDLRFFT